MAWKNDKQKPQKKAAASLSERDSAIWEAVKKTVTPLENKTAPAPLAPIPRGIRYRDTELPAEWSAGAKAEPMPSLERKTRRKIVTGRQEFDRSIDLHGMTQNEAHSVLLRVIEGCILRGDRTLLVVTGKGGKRFRQMGDEQPIAYRTRDDFQQNTGVLRRMVPMWLNGPDLKKFVHSYGPAAADHGGDGALYVVLRKTPAKTAR